MELIEPSVELVLQSTEKNGGYKHIERCARVCYQSDGKTTATSWKKFYNNLITRGHLSPLEHETVYLYIPYETDAPMFVRAEIGRIRDSKHTARFADGNTTYYVTNRRVIEEIGAEKAYELYGQSGASKMFDFARRYTLRIICDRGVSHELVRHRVFSFCQESTRYCDYQGAMQFVVPSRWGELTDDTRMVYLQAFSDAGKTYRELRQIGQSPQQARAVLPNALKTELYMTGFESDWADLIQKRTANGVHPDMVKVAKMMADVLYEQTGNKLFKLE